MLPSVLSPRLRFSGSRPIRADTFFLRFHILSRFSSERDNLREEAVRCSFLCASSDRSVCIGMKQPQYARYERGLRDIPTDILIRLALYYDTSADYILELTDDIKPYPRR